MDLYLRILNMNIKLLEKKGFMEIAKIVNVVKILIAINKSKLNNLSVHKKRKK